MAFAPAWRLALGAASSMPAAAKGASVCPPKRGGRAVARRHFARRCSRHFLNRPHHFRLVLQHGKRASGDYWQFYYLRTRRSRRARLGVIIAKKQVRRAHRRNRIRRIVREFFRQHRAASMPAMDILLRYSGTATVADSLILADVDNGFAAMSDVINSGATNSSHE